MKSILQGMDELVTNLNPLPIRAQVLFLEFQKKARDKTLEAYAEELKLGVKGLKAYYLRGCWQTPCPIRSRDVESSNPSFTHQICHSWERCDINP